MGKLPSWPMLLSIAPDSEMLIIMYPYNITLQGIDVASFRLKHIKRMWRSWFCAINIWLYVRQSPCGANIALTWQILRWRAWSSKNNHSTIDSSMLNSFCKWCKHLLGSSSASVKPVSAGWYVLSILTKWKWCYYIVSTVFSPPMNLHFAGL